MDKQKLIDYLKMILDIEQAIYTRNNFDQELIKLQQTFKNPSEKRYIQKQITALERANIDSERVLEKLYNQGIIYYKYRNIIAIAAFIEYLESGRCSSLDGDFGAYNKFDKEDLLHTIINNQEITHHYLQDLNNTLNKIGATLFRIENLVKETNQITLDLYESVKKSLVNLENKQDKINTNFNKFIHNQKDEINELNSIKVNSAIIAYNTQQSKKELEYMRRMEDYDRGKWWSALL